MDLEPLFTVAAYGTAAIGTVTFLIGLVNLFMAKTPFGEISMERKERKQAEINYKRYLATGTGFCVASAYLFTLT